MDKRREILTWTELTRLIDHLLAQFNKPYTCLLPVNQAAIIPATMLAEAMEIKHLFLISVQFPLDMHRQPPHDPLSIELPLFRNFLHLSN